MSDPKEPPKGPELSEEALDNVAGGAVDIFLNIDGVRGESLDDKHKNEIHIE